MSHKIEIYSKECSCCGGNGRIQYWHGRLEKYVSDKCTVCDGTGLKPYARATKLVEQNGHIAQHAQPATDDTQQAVG